MCVFPRYNYPWHAFLVRVWRQPTCTSARTRPRASLPRSICHREYRRRLCGPSSLRRPFLPPRPAYTRVSIIVRKLKSRAFTAGDDAQPVIYCVTPCRDLVVQKSRVMSFSDKSEKIETSDRLDCTFYSPTVFIYIASKLFRAYCKERFIILSILSVNSNKSK